VAFPTETVYGLGASAFDEAAIRKIFAAKGRPSDNPLIAHIASLDQIPLLAKRVTPAAEKFIARFFPGPLTVILPKNPRVPDVATAGLDTIGVRMPSHKIAAAFLRACGMPVVAPSANRSGLPSPTVWQAVRDDLNGRVSCVLQGGASDVGLESTVVDCTGRAPRVLRAGAITLEQLREVVPSTRMHRPRKDGAARSPGMKHRHYAPRARVVLVDSLLDAECSDHSSFIGLRTPLLVTGFGRVALCRDTAEYARVLFRFFRACDASGITTIFCETVPDEDLGRALMDRLRRAAAR
jgi:L-threonylcarbamoyladenylate synthase